MFCLQILLFTHQCSEDILPAVRWRDTGMNLNCKGPAISGPQLQALL